LTRKDFEAYEVIIRKPLHFHYGNYQILTNPLPSTGGSLIALMLHELEKTAESHLDKAYILNLLKTLKKVANFGKLPHELAKALTATLQKNPSKHGSTTHFNIVDKDGNAVSLTTTNGEGSGLYIENTEVQLNNMLGEAALVPEGFHNWRNDVRLSSMMSPTLVLDAQNEFKAALGSGGAGRIPSMIMQVLHKLIDYNLRPSLAIESPRVHLMNGQFNIETEGFEELPNAKDLEEKLILFKKKSIYFGGVHSVVNKNGKLTGIGDSRREGMVI
jgi:gamma-glutamyltranspeptidase/glutathione hydrolase